MAIIFTNDKYSKALNFLAKDKEKLFLLYIFPAANWIRIRMINPIESTFDTM